jgi:hypothetical protein
VAENTRENPFFTNCQQVVTTRLTIVPPGL